MEAGDFAIEVGSSSRDLAVSVIGTMPMSTLAAFNGMAFDFDALTKLVAHL